ncbi:TPA: N-ethylammeline chlorohydrolase, partial [Candidatus Micrarchaeota archaeon]|nr:N-ethylammeline chlorohydrolase [Candidatus Micrarchaeota archaeon]
MDILIRNATIVTQNGKREILHGDILVKDGRIAEVSPSTSEKAEHVIDASGKIAMPGLVNAHTHVAMTIFRGYGEDLPLQEWLERKIWPIEAKQTPEDAGIAAKLAFCEMIRGGTTCFSEMCIVGAKEVAESAREAGIRGDVAQGLMDKVPGKDIAGQLKLMESSAHESDGLVKSSVGPHALYTC